MKSLTQVVLVHGGDSFATSEEYLDALKNWPVTINDFKPKDDWKARLPGVLGPAFEVLAPRMPNKQNARYEEWQIWFGRLVPFIKDDVILIGHSLGGIFLAKYLAQNRLPRKIRGLALVAPPHNSTPEIGDFALLSSLQLVSDQVNKIAIFHSHDDPVVPFSESAAYQRDLPSAKIVALDGRGHLNQPEFPELLEWISAC